MTAILYRASAGVAGDVTRPDDTIVESAIMDTTNPPTAYGAPVKMVNGKLQAFTASDDETALYGILSRSVPSISGDLAQAFADGTPNPAAPQGVVVQGYILVKCKNQTAAARGAQVVLLEAGEFSGIDEGPNDKYLPKLTFATSGSGDEELSEIRVSL